MIVDVTDFLPDQAVVGFEAGEPLLDEFELDGQQTGEIHDLVQFAAIAFLFFQLQKGLFSLSNCLGQFLLLLVDILSCCSKFFSELGGHILDSFLVVLSGLFKLVLQ
jgi:hypothetical protein